MAAPSSSPAQILERTTREARRRWGNGSFADRLQAKYGRAPSLAFMDFYDDEALDKKYLDEEDGEDKRVLVQIMTGEEGCDEPVFYDDHAHIMVDHTLFEVLAEVDRVFEQECKGPTISSSLPGAFLIAGYSKDGNDELYAWRICYTFCSPINDLSDVLDEAAVAAEIIKQDNEVAAAAAAAATTTGN